MAMRFCVSVPVLSTQSRVVEPSVSVTEERRTSTLRPASRKAPMARKIASTIGNSSGSRLMASVMPAMAPSNQSP